MKKYIIRKINKYMGQKGTKDADLDIIVFFCSGFPPPEYQIGGILLSESAC